MSRAEPLPDFAAGVCSNCGQWQHKDTGDCFNECAKRGFAERAEAPK